MTSQPSSRKVLPMNWDSSAEQNLDWNCPGMVSIVFRINLPEMQPSLTGAAQSRTQLPTETGSETSAHPANNPVLRILMIEDSEDDCALICHRLRKCGYTPQVGRVFCEKTIRAALEREQWDIVFTDHGLPGFSGPAAIRLLREIGVHLPVLCITGTLDPAIIRKMLAAGVSACISKDDLSLLCRAVERALKPNTNISNS